MIVQDVDEPGEAPRAVAHLGGHPRDAGQEQHRELARELEVVALRARAVAQRREVEPDGAARARRATSVRPSIASRGDSSGPRAHRLERAPRARRRPRGPAGTW